MAVAFTNYFNGELMPFYVRYLITIMWIVLWLIISRGKIKKELVNNLKTYILPFLMIGVWTLVVWAINPPAVLSHGFVSRMVSNILYLVLTYACAAAGCDLFKRDVIKLSIISMVLSTVANIVVVVSSYDISMFITYLTNAFSTTDYDYGSPMELLARYLEVQDITMASGFYILYFVLFNKEKKLKENLSWILLACFCGYIGFKRTLLIGVLFVILLHFVLKSKRLGLKNLIYIIGIGYMILSFAYVVMIDYGVLEVIAATTGINFMGRIGIYKILTTYIEISPFFLGNGFCYVDKRMYEDIGFASHSVVIRMFAEIGCIPFFMWIYHYLIRVPNRYLKKYGKETAFVSFVLTVYMFITFFMENTLSLFCVQFSFFMIPLAISYPPVERKRRSLLRMLGRR